MQFLHFLAFSDLTIYNWIHYIEVSKGKPVILISGSYNTYRVWNRIVTIISQQGLISGSFVTPPGNVLLKTATTSDLPVYDCT